MYTTKQSDHRAWRLKNIYVTLDIQNRMVPFKPNQVQKLFLSGITDENITLKAGRRYGIETATLIHIVDMAVFGLPGKNIVIYANTEGAADSMFESLAENIKRGDSCAKESRPNSRYRSAFFKPLLLPETRAIQLDNGTTVFVSTNPYAENTCDVVYIPSAHWYENAGATQMRRYNKMYASVERKGAIFLDFQPAEIETESNVSVFRLMLGSTYRSKLQRGLRKFYARWFMTEHESVPGKETLPWLDKYFDSVEETENVEISKANRAWYQHQLQTVYCGDIALTRRELPSDVEEAYS